MSLEDTFIMEDVKSLSNSSEELNVNNEEQLPVYNHLLDSSGNILIPTSSESEENTEELPHLHSTDLQGCVQNIAQHLNPHKPTLITVANLNESQANSKIADPTQGQIKTKKSKSLENIPNSQKSEVFFVDYGVTEDVSLDKCRKILPQFNHLPSQAVYCVLSKVYMETMEEGEINKAVIVMENYLLNKTIDIKVTDSEIEDNKLEVVAKLDDVNINELVVIKGFCSPF